MSEEQNNTVTFTPVFHFDDGGEHEIKETIAEAVEHAEEATTNANNAAAACRGTIGSDFSPLVSYTVGSYVWYNNVLYCFTSPHHGEWTGEDVVPGNIADDFSSFRNLASNSIESAHSRINRDEIDILATSIIHTAGPSEEVFFLDGSNRGSMKAVVTITPTQSGSGDPSLDNIRPILTTSSVDITVKPDSQEEGVATTVALDQDVAGGVLTINRDGTGELKITHHYAVIDGTEDWTLQNGQNENPKYLRATKDGNDDRYPGVTDAANAKFSASVTALPTSNNDNVGMYMYTSSGNSYPYIYARLDDMTGVTADSWKTQLAALKTANTPMTVAYKLSTPRTYALTASQIKSLLGLNYVTTSAGKITVEYIADPNCYVDELNYGLRTATDVSDTFLDGKYFDLSGEIGSTISVLAIDPNYCRNEIACKAGDRFTITASTEQEDGAIIWAFADENKAILRKANQGENASNLTLIADHDGYFYANALRANTHTLYVDTVHPVAKEVASTRSYVDKIFESEFKLLDMSPTIKIGSYWAFADGTVHSSNKFMRTSKLYANGYRDAINLDDETYLYSMIYEDANHEIVETVDPMIGLTIFPEYAKFVCVNFKRADGENVSDSDKTAVLNNLKFYKNIAYIDASTERTDNVIDIRTLTNLHIDNDNHIVSGTANQFDGQVLAEISGGGRYHFEFDYVNSKGATGTSGPSITAVDENGDNVNIVSVKTGTSNTVIQLSNFKSYIHRSFELIFPQDTEKIVFGLNGTPSSDNVFYFRNIKVTKLPKKTVRQIPDYYPDYSAVDYIARNDIHSGFTPQGGILMLNNLPNSIPVNENHMGYNEFIATTWETLLPDDYTEGDPYDESTTKIHNVFVERQSDWMSTPYGDNTDTYTIYRYIFTPQTGYEKTVFLTSGCHGNEAEGYWSLYRIIRMIYFESYKYPVLRNLRNVRYIIVPSWNPWGFQHYRRYNAFAALNTGNTDVAKNYQPWAWLMDSTHSKTINGVTYDITDIGEANVIWQTLNEFKGALDLWVDIHTDPYAGRDTTSVDIDNPRGYEDPYGCYGFAAEGSRTYYQLLSVMADFFNIMKDEYSFTETWHPVAASPNTNNSFTAWQTTLGFPCGLVEVSTFMNNFPYASGSAEMMKLAEEFYATCIMNMI